jgi:hypothetical protein
VGSHAGLDGRLSGRGPADDIEADLLMGLDGRATLAQALLQRLLKRGDDIGINGLSDHRPLARLCDRRGFDRR